VIIGNLVDLLNQVIYKNSLTTGEFLDEHFLVDVVETKLL
jgi:hypothetical protein